MKEHTGGAVLTAISFVVGVVLEVFLFVETGKWVPSMEQIRGWNASIEVVVEEQDVTVNAELQQQQPLLNSLLPADDTQGQKKWEDPSQP